MIHAQFNLSSKVTGKNGFVCVCVCVMATNFLELATTLKYLGAKWLPGKKVNFTPCIGLLVIVIESRSSPVL